MKKLLAAVVCAALLMGVVVPAAAAEAVTADTIQISTPQQLADIAKNPGSHYQLTTDINMKGVDWAPCFFSGVFDGNGHTIYNLSIKKLGEKSAVTVDGNNKVYDGYFAGMFSVLQNATVENLTLLNTKVSITTDKNSFAACLVGYMEKSTIMNCTVLAGRVYLEMSSHMSGVGGLAGFGAEGAITDSKSDATLTFVDKNPDYKVEQFLGGILSCGSADITGCTTKVRGYDSIIGYAHQGGIVGMYHVLSGQKPAAISGCKVDAEISFFENNTDRRAYCEPYAGERLGAFAIRDNNQTLNFKRNETFDYSKILLPEGSDRPQYTTSVTRGDCTHFGYTTYTSTNNGYAYTDNYTPKVHIPGNWVAEKAPTAGKPGSLICRCKVCGELLGRRTIRFPLPN